METLGQDLETMRRVPLATAHVDGICAIGDEVFYPAGSIVMDIGVPMDRFIYVLEGDIEVVDPHTNERMLKSSLGPTQFLGEIGFLNGATNIMRMRASVDRRVDRGPAPGDARTDEPGAGAVRSPHHRNRCKAAGAVRGQQ